MHEDLDSLMEKYEVDAILSYGNAFETPDIYWLTGFCSPDYIIYFKNRADEPLVASNLLTLDRVKKESFITHTFDLTEIYLQILRENKKIVNNEDRLFNALLKAEFSGSVLGVPDNFPTSLFVMLQEAGYTPKVVRDLVLEARATKTPKEIKTIRKAGQATTTAISQVIDLVNESTIGPNKILMHKGSPLTVDSVKLALEHALLDQRAESSEDAILAVGKKGFDWHYLGAPKDRLKADVPIILDVFPRLKRERYVADVTRTFVRGKVSKPVRKMFDAVQDAINATIDVLTDGSNIDEVNLACFNTLKQHGFDSLRLNPDANDGMTHGLGHGIGLEVHEQPSMYNREDHFIEGHVMAIEPGVYLPNIGGVRIENDYVVTKGKAKLLTPNLETMLFL
jgi:Xaa-Pro aminopeptidase